jgi:hypothetical protein
MCARSHGVDVETPVGPDDVGMHRLEGPATAGGRELVRVMVLMKSTAATEAGVRPSEEALREMGRFNEELVNSGVLLAGDGLHPSDKGVRVRFDGDRRTVIDGPFTETKELIAGYWLWQVSSMEEAIEWAKRIPNPTGDHAEVELRPVLEAEDFGEAYTDAVREQEDRIRAKLER